MAICISREVRYVLVDSHPFSVKCPKTACAPAVLWPGRDVGARCGCWHWDGGREDSPASRRATRKLPVPPVGTWHSRPVPWRGGEVAGLGQHTVQRFSGDGGLFVSGSFCWGFGFLVCL